MNAKARLEEIRDKLLERTRAKLEIDYSGRGVLTVNDVMQILLEAGVTLPPQPAGPVTSEEAVAAYAAGYARASGVFREHTEEALANKRKAGMDAAMPLLARDHGLLTPAEVERRARAWWSSHYGRPVLSGVPDSLVTALTASAATGAASTAPAAPICASCGERKEKCNGC